MVDIRDYAQNYIAQYREGEFETVIAAVRRRKVLTVVAAYAHRKILEVGCGFEPLFPNIDGFEDYWAIEPLPEAVAAARQRASGADHIHVVDGFLESAGDRLPPVFDFIIVSSLLHEVDDPTALLAAVRARCGPETIVHFNVPNVYSFHRLLALEAGLISDIFDKSATEVRFQRRTRFDRERLESMVKEAGFEIVDSATYFIKPFTHRQMERMLEAGIIDRRIVDGLDRMTRYLPDLGCEMYVNVRRK